MIYVVPVILMLLSGCRKVTISREVYQMHHTVAHQMGITLERTDTDELIVPTLTRMMTFSDIVRLALCKNPVLHSLYDDIGIAKADLVQQGLYTNPRILSSIKIPVSKVLDYPVDIDVLTLFSMNDFWQVPRQRQVYADELELAIMRVEKEILAIRALAAKTFNDMMIARKHLEAIKEIRTDVQEVIDQLNKVKKVGDAAQELEVSHFEAKVGEYDMLAIDAQNNYEIAREKLRLIMDITLDELSTIQFIDTPLPVHQYSFEQWHQAALSNRIDIRSARMKIQKEEHELDYEEANILKEVSFGFDIDRNEGTPDSSGVRGIGSRLISPTFIVAVPIFDQNQAQIAKARFKLSKARKEYEAEKNKTYSEIMVAYKQVITAHEKMQVYLKSVKAKHMTSLDQARDLFHADKMTADTLLSSFDSYYQANDKVLNLELEARNALTTLELAAGIVLDGLPQEQPQK